MTLSIDVKPSNSTVSEKQEDWYGQHQWQCGYERGWDAAMEQKREWVGLAEQDVHDAFQFTELIKQLSFDRERPEWCENFAAYIEAKLKEKNT
jgi:hypothetical protein